MMDNKRFVLRCVQTEVHMISR